MTEFNPIAVGDKIAGHIAAADRAKEAHDTESKTAGALLLDVAQNHPEHLEAICARIGLGLSRRKELLMIAGGRRTLEKSRADNKARQDRHRAKKRALTKRKPLQPPVTADKGSGNKVDPDVGAEAMKAAQAAAEGQPQAAGPTPVEPIKPDPKTTIEGKVTTKRRPSDQALAEFKFATRQYLPDMNPHDQRKAIEYVSEMIERLNRELAA